MPQLTASRLAETDVGWGGDWLPASLAIGSQGTRLPSGEAGSRERAPGLCGQARLRHSFPPPSAPPSAPPPSPAPCRCLSFSEPRTASSEGTRGSPPPPLWLVSWARPGPAARGEALLSPAWSPAIAARSSCLWSHEGFPASHLWTSLSFSPRVRREPALRPERAWGPPAEKASRGPIRHGGRRRRERQEKVSLSLPPAALCAGAPARPPPRARGPASAFRGPPFCFCLFSPPLSFPQPRGPGSPSAHVAILSWGARDASKVLSGAGGWAPLALPSGPPGPRTALPTCLKKPARPVPHCGWTSPSLKAPGEK